MSRSIALFACCLFPLTLVAGDPFRFPEAKHGTGQLKYVKDLPILTVSGTPDQIGEAVGVLAVKPAARVLDYPKGVMTHFNAGVLYNLVVSKGKEMAKNFPADATAEMDAMIRSSGAPRDKVVAGNTLFDIKKIVLCSALMAESDRSETRGPLMGRNLDYPSLGYIHEYSLVTVYRPKDKHAFVSVGFPGLIGCLSGMNDAGLSVAVLEVLAAREGEGRFDPKGLPYAMCFRTILEECTTIDEAKKRLEKLPRTTILNMIVADKNRVGTFEVTPKTIVFRPAEKGICSCTNHFCTEVKPKDKVNIADTYERFDILESVRKFERKVTVEDVRSKLDEVNLGTLTLQTMVFEPATLKMHLSFGAPPASRHELRTVDLGPLFKNGK